MSWLVIVGIVITAVLCWRFLKIILAYTVPEEVTGRKYFRQRLLACGISTAHLPPEFFEESVRWAQMVARGNALANPAMFARKAELVRALDILAQMAALWRREPDSPMFRSNDPHSYRALFEKYGI